MYFKVAHFFKKHAVRLQNNIYAIRDTVLGFKNLPDVSICMSFHLSNGNKCQKSKSVKIRCLGLCTE